MASDPPITTVPDDGGLAAEWECRLQSERTARKEAERLLEAKSRELYEANQRLQEANQHLEDKVRARTVDLEEALAAAKKASEAKTDFLALMSHELRTPLNGIIGTATLLIDTDMGDSHREPLHIIQDSAETLLSILNNILDFSKIESGEFDIEWLPINIANALDYVSGLTMLGAEAKNLVYSIDIDPRMPMYVIGDESRLRQILLNLCNNAVKFTETGSIEIKVKVIEQEPESVLARFEVHDTGMGIPADRMGELFQPFGPLDASSRREFGGTGLGLVISHRLVSLLEGEIGVDSQEGQGSCFWFQIRFRRDDSADVAAEPIDAFRGCRVLLVDDNEINLNVIGRQAEALGLKVRTADTPDAALLSIVSSANTGVYFDYCLIDYNMPGMNGSDLAKIFRQLDSSKDSCLLLVSSSTGGSHHLLENGGPFDGVVRKPLHQQRLRHAMERLPPRQRIAPEQDDVIAVPMGSGSILVVEDQEINRRVIKAHLEQAGYTVTTAVDGGIGIEVANQAPFDVILMDIQMPKLDGISATDRIRRESAMNARTPVIAVTACALAGDRQRFLKAGLDDYVAKPIRPAELLDRIAYWKERGSSEVEAVVAADRDEPAPATDEADIEAISTLLSLLEPDEIGALIETFENQLNELKALVDTVSDATELPTLCGLAHKVLGGAVAVGGSSVGTVAGELEQQAQAGDLTAVKVLTPSLDAAVTDWRANLKAAGVSR